jgi:hypothetical protein
VDNAIRPLVAVTIVTMKAELPRRRLRLVSGVGAGLDEWLDRDEADELEPHWLPSFVATRSLSENAFSLARPMWGKARAEWTIWLAGDVLQQFPGAGVGKAKRGWVAGILWAAAVDAEMDRSLALWEHVLNDITSMTGASRATAKRRWRDLQQFGLTRPTNAPSWWRRSRD